MDAGEQVTGMDAGTPSALRSPSLWRRFRRSRTASAGIAVVAALFVVAALAPFLAGNRPLLFSDGRGLEMPVFRAFDSEDFLWFGGLVAVIVYWCFSRIARRLDGKNGERRAGRARAICALTLAAAVLIGGLSWPDRLIHEDYRPFRDGEREAAGLCVFPPIPYAPSEVPLRNLLQAPGGSHLFGTDRNGDDVLARMIHGTRISLVVGFAAALVCLLIGVSLGAAAGFFGGMADALICRLIEVVTCFPAFFAVLAVLAFLPPHIMWVMLLIGLVRWPGVARLTRGEFLKLRESEFVAAARAMGLSNRRIICSHVLPNALAPVIVSATFGVAGAILIESGLSFLGIGPLTCQSWGRLLSEFRPYFDVAWWLSVFPGAGIFVTVTAFNLVGEGLRDALDPRLNE
jgi:peptide/nickel transport system permease protein